jgi:hypothetical protein
MDDGMHDIVLDIAKVTHMDSRALAVVLAVHRRMEEVGGTFVICGATPLNVRLFNAAGLAFCLSDWQGDRVVPMGYRAYPGDTSHKCLVYGSTVRTDGAGRAAAGGVLI